ncbi:MAG: hypothetical protein IPK26_29695 [Planctomycetes bacterium]|nr:hypothetical protein [Planctomycetota bacterium]
MNCPRCGCAIPDFSGLDPALRARVGAQVRLGHCVAGTQTLVGAAGWSMRDAKAVVSHLVASPGRCRKCRGPVADTDVTECPRCRSLNLLW